MVAGLFGCFFLGTLYLQRVLGYDAMQVGLVFLPVALAIRILSVDFSARLTTRFGARTVLLAGLPLVLGGLALFIRVPVDGDYLVGTLPAMLLVGRRRRRGISSDDDACHVGRHPERRWARERHVVDVA